MREQIKVFKALSDGSRLRILKLLEKKSLCVCEITSILQFAPSTVSKHLSILRDVNLVIDEKSGKWVNYRLNPEIKQKYVKVLLQNALRWLENDPVILKDRSFLKKIDRFEICSSNSD